MKISRFPKKKRFSAEGEEERRRKKSDLVLKFDRETRSQSNDSIEREE
jgi:hypothetical protein